MGESYSCYKCIDIFSANKQRMKDLVAQKPMAHMSVLKPLINIFKVVAVHLNPNQIIEEG